MPVREITDEQLVKRAMMNARPRKFGDWPWPRFGAVMEIFALGSGYSVELCISHGLDPYELLSGPCCEVCDEDHEE